MAAFYPMALGGCMGAAEKLSEIYTFRDLQKMCQPGKNPRRATVEAWADREGIAYRYDGCGGIWTTHQALNVALGLKKPSAVEAQYSPEDIA
ncbi:hypothetical protein ABE424_13160 [Stenotrophomonas sp. TWI1149]|uniref:hypothetical protein n=1 Tax=unclassified Stenotrophomonas TaxID=196198 RepID=UPI00320B6747